MSKGGSDHFDEFADHTLLKHLVLDKYVKRWGFKLLNGKASRQVWFVDAFAGEGYDNKKNPGSPVIAGRIAEDLASQFSPTPNREAPMRILAIELDQQRGRKLQEAMKPFHEHAPSLAEVRTGITLHELLDRFLDHVGDTPTLFFLDPFGVDGLLVADLPSLLGGPRNEVFSLFADIGAKRLFATLRSSDRDVPYEVQQVYDRPSLFSEMTEEDATRVRRQGERSNEARKNTQVAARRILEEALGEHYEEKLGDVKTEDLPDQALRIWTQRLIDAGAAYVLSLPVRDSRNAHVYQLVYATKSVHGLRAMKDSIQEALNGSTLPREVIAAIESNFSADEEEVVRTLQQRFAGKRVRWTDTREEDSVVAYLYEATPLISGQFETIKQALIGRGWKEPGRTIYFRFPS